MSENRPLETSSVAHTLPLHFKFLFLKHQIDFGTLEAAGVWYLGSRPAWKWWVLYSNDVILARLCLRVSRKFSFVLKDSRT